MRLELLQPQQLPMSHLRNPGTHWFGMMGACFGGGMIAGPVIGGFAGQLSVQAPFMFAAAINGLAFLVSLFILHETHNANQVSDELKNETINETTSSIREMISPLSGLLVVFSSFN